MKFTRPKVLMNPFLISMSTKNPSFLMVEQHCKGVVLRQPLGVLQHAQYTDPNLLKNNIKYH